MHTNPDNFETVHLLHESAFFTHETNESALRNRIFKASSSRFQIRNMRINSEMSRFPWIGPLSFNWRKTRDTQLIKRAWNLYISKSSSSPIASSRLSEEIKKWTGYVFYLFAIMRKDWETTYFDLSKFCFKVPLNGQQRRTTCFATYLTLLQNELNSDGAWFTAHVQTCLATN